MRKNTKIVLFILFVGVVSSIFLFLKRGSSTIERPEAPPTSPKIPRYLEGEVGISFNLSKENFLFPEKLPLLSVNTSSFSKDDAKAIAGRLNFSGEPDEFEDTKEGIKYYWTNQEKFLVVTPKTATIKYGPREEVFPKTTRSRLSDEDLITLAKDFFVGSGILSTDKIGAVSISYLKGDEGVEGFSESSKDSAQLFQINLNYSVSEFEILTINPSLPLVYVRILPDGTVFDAQATIFQTVTLGLTEYRLKTYDEVVSSAKDLVLVALLNDFINLAELSARDVQGASVEKIRLAYLYDSLGATYLQPVFVLEGPVKVAGSEANRAVFYLPAFSSQL